MVLSHVKDIPYDVTPGMRVASLVSYSHPDTLPLLEEESSR